MNNLMPSAEFTALITQLKGIEHYAREFLLPKGKAAIEREQSDACISSVERQQASRIQWFLATIII